MSALAEALVAFQKEAPALHEDATNPHYKNRYLSLEGLMKQVLPVLTRNKLALLQFPTVIEGQPGLRTKLLHESGEFEEDTMLLSLAKQGPQEQGSGLTYARRYAAMAILGLVADEDDDGNVATRPAAAVARPAAPAPSSAFQGPTDPVDNTGIAIHFGKNAGRPLSSLTKNQVKWYAETWEIDPARQSPQDLALKAAAIELHGGAALPSSPAIPVDDSIPFQRTI